MSLREQDPNLLIGYEEETPNLLGDPNDVIEYNSDDDSYEIIT